MAPRLIVPVLHGTGVTRVAPKQANPRRHKLHAARVWNTYRRLDDAGKSSLHPHAGLRKILKIAAPLHAPTSTDHSLVALGDILKTIEVPEAEFYIGQLFRRKFGDPAPDFPRHFVAIYKAAPTEFWPVGYIHFSRFDDSFLGGGLVIDDRAYRRMPDARRKSIRDAGGIAEKMFREALAVLSEAPAVWVYVGDAKSERVSLRVGFRHADHPYLMVVWNKDVADDEKYRRLARVSALGPF